MKIINGGRTKIDLEFFENEIYIPEWGVISRGRDEDARVKKLMSNQNGKNVIVGNGKAEYDTPVAQDDWLNRFKNYLGDGCRVEESPAYEKGNSIFSIIISSNELIIQLCVFAKDKTFCVVYVPNDGDFIKTAGLYSKALSFINNYELKEEK